jgi:tripartite-type tricarboxylate transporter receptor subunit TctC
VIKARLATSGNEPIASSPAEFAVFLRSEMEKWAGVIKTSGIQKIE